MKIDKPQKSRKQRNNMNLKEADIDQLAVFDELMSDALIKISRIKTVQRYKKVNGVVVLEPDTLAPVLVDYAHEKLSFKKMVEDYKKFRKAKKEFIKQLEVKYVNRNS